MTVLVRTKDPEQWEPTADLCLSLPAGRRHGRAGLAELALAALLDAAAGASGRPSLRSSIEGLGGTVQALAGPSQSEVYLRVPAARWQEAVAAIALALAEPATSRQRLETVRRRYLETRAAALNAEVSPLAAARDLLAGAGGPAEHLEALQDRDPAEIVLFASRHYRPEGTVLAIELPGADPEAAAGTAAEAFSIWRPGAGGGAPQRSLEAPSGIHWVPAEGECRAVFLFALPDPLGEEAARQWMLQECLTMEGVGGRLERAFLQTGRGFEFRTRILHPGGGQYWLALSAPAKPREVRQLWELVEGARSSLVAVGPSESEKALARGRARLALLDQRRTPWQRLRLTIRQAQAAGSDDPLPDQLTRLQDRDLDLDAAAPAWQKLPAAVLVVGGEAVAGEGVTVHPAFNRKVLDRILGTDPGTGMQEAREVLDRALQALGGAHKLFAVRGYRAVAELSEPGAPAIEERVELVGADLHRVRRVLATEIETTIEGGVGVERSGGESIAIEPRRVARLIREANRNPLMLLAAHARGRLPFRLVSVRQVDGRDIAVLEAVRSPWVRLRLHVDLAAGLPRVVEAWREDETGPMYLRETFSDYRQSGGIRVPFRRITDLEDGSGRLQTVYREFEPVY